MARLSHRAAKWYFVHSAPKPKADSEGGIANKMSGRMLEDPRMAEAPRWPSGSFRESVISPMA